MVSVYFRRSHRRQEFIRCSSEPGAVSWALLFASARCGAGAAPFPCHQVPLSSGESVQNMRQIALFVKEMPAPGASKAFSFGRSCVGALKELLAEHRIERPLLVSFGEALMQAYRTKASGRRADRWC